MNSVARRKKGRRFQFAYRQFYVPTNLNIAFARFRDTLQPPLMHLNTRYGTAILEFIDATHIDHLSESAAIGLRFKSIHMQVEQWTVEAELGKSSWSKEGAKAIVQMDGTERIEIHTSSNDESEREQVKSEVERLLPKVIQTRAMLTDLILIVLRATTPNETLVSAFAAGGEEIVNVLRWMEAAAHKLWVSKEGTLEDYPIDVNDLRLSSYTDEQKLWIVKRNMGRMHEVKKIDRNRANAFLNKERAIAPFLIRPPNQRLSEAGRRKSESAKRDEENRNSKPKPV